MRTRAQVCGGSVPAMAAGGAILAAAADFLFYGKLVGWTAGAFVALLALSIVCKRPRAAVIAPLLFTLGLALAMALEPSPLNVILGIVGLIAIAATTRAGWTASVHAWARRIGWYAIAPVVAPCHDAALVHRRLWRGGRLAAEYGATASRSTVGIVRWALPVSLGAVFVLLFRQANPIIAGWLSNLEDLVRVQRILLWLGVMLAAWALWRQRVAAPTLREPAAHDTASRLLDLVVSPGVVVRCLLLFNAIFAVQTLLDARYLWGGASLPDGMTYAEYARRGAYPLVATALLAGAFVLVTFRAGGAAERSGLARKLVYLWIAQNVLLLGAAAWRLGLYVDAYSLTRWRVAAAIWMGVVAVGFALVVWRIVAQRSNAWLGRGCALLGLATLYACAFPDVDGFIADFNVRRCAEVRGEGQPIDLAYLESLGIEAIPALAWLKHHAYHTPTVASAHELHSRLQARLSHDTADWRGYTLRRARLLAAAKSP